MSRRRLSTKTCSADFNHFRNYKNKEGQAISKFIASLADMLLSESHGINLQVYPGETELLVEVFLGKRKQQVSVKMIVSKKNRASLVRLLSRALSLIHI